LDSKLERERERERERRKNHVVLERRGRLEEEEKKKS